MNQTVTLQNNTSLGGKFHRKSLLIFISALSFIQLNAQNYQWARIFGNSTTYDQVSTSVKTDASGNYYVTGYFENVADFDPGPSATTLTASLVDIYVSKFDNTGNFIWVKQIGGTGNDYANDLTISSAGDLLLTGFFGGTADFDPGSSTYTLSAPTCWETFVLKLDTNGGFIWAKQLGSTSTSCVYGQSIEVDASGNVYTTGHYQGIVDMDPGTGTNSLNPVGINVYDAFISKLDVNGAFVWGKSIGGSGHDYGKSIDVDASGNVFVGGSFSGSADFDPSTSSFSITASGGDEAFILKLNSSGTFVWAKSVGGNYTDEIKGLTVDGAGSIYAAGIFSGTADFDPGSSTYTLTSGISAIWGSFLLKLNAAGSFVWAKGLDGSTSMGTAVDLDAAANVYWTGNYNGTVDINPGAPVQNVTSVGNNDPYIVALDSTGTFISFSRIGGNGQEYPNAIDVTGTGSFVICGWLLYSGDIDAGPGVTSYSTTAFDAFLAKFSCAPSPAGSITGNTNVCVQSIQQFTTPIIPGATSYSWSVPPGASIISQSSNSVQILFGNSSGEIVVTGSNSCGTGIQSSLTIVASPAPTIVLNTGSVCAGQNFTINPAGASSYTFLNGGPVVNPTITTTYSVTGTSTSGCSLMASTQVSVVARPIISANTGGICPGNAFTIVPSGASTYTYYTGSGTVSGSSTSVTPTITTTYSIVGTTSSGCVSSNTAMSSVTVYPIPFITVTSGSICMGNIFTMTAYGALTYTFSGGSTVVTPTVDTSYSVTGTSSLGCISTNTAVASVTVHARPVISVNSGSICSGQNFTIIPSGALTYSVSGNALVVSPLTNTIYFVVGYNNVGCASSNTAVVNLTISPPPLMFAVVNPNKVCEGETFTLSAGGTTSYTWSNNNSGANTTVVAVANTTTYQATGSNPGGCIGLTNILTVTVYPNPTITASGSTTICAGQSATLHATSAYNIFWSSGGQGSTKVVSPTITTQYVALSSSSNCTSTAAASVIVNVNPLPVVSISGTPFICPGTSAILTASGAATYSWVPGIGTGSFITVSPLSTTQYTVKGTSNNGCVSYGGYLLYVKNQLTVVPVINSTIACEGEPLLVIALGAKTYTWTGGITNNTQFTLATSRSFTVTGEDVDGCKDTAVVSVVILPKPSLTVISTPSLICAGEIVSLTATGAQSYYWSTGDTASVINITRSATDTLTLKGTGSNGCIKISVITVVVDPCTDVQNYSSSAQINIYPNPNTGSFNITCKEQVTLLLYNELGQKLWDREVQGDMTVNVKDLAKGIYHLKVVHQHDHQTFKVLVTD